MRILVVSDSHGNDSALFKAHQQAGAVDLLIHTGDGEQDATLAEGILDCEVLRVAGNCDLGSTAPRELVITLDGMRLLITHGDRQQVKSGLARLEQYARDLRVDAVLFGHTHQAYCEQREGLLLLNPGTLFRQAACQSFAILECGPAGLSATLHQLA